MINNPVNLYVTNSTSVTVFYNGTDATSGIQGYQYALDGAGYSGTAAPIFHLFSGLSNACAEALSKLRINPGNVGRGSKRDPQFAEMIETACT